MKEKSPRYQMTSGPITGPARKVPNSLCLLPAGVALLALASFGLGSCGSGSAEECIPECAGRCCGDDGCGGTCPDLCSATGQACDRNTCECTGVCVPLTCSELGKECGDWPDGCGGVVKCGGCPADQVCGSDGICRDTECVPDCDGRCCGPDGCGGTCSDTCSGQLGFCDVKTCTCTSVCDYQLKPTTSFRRLDTRGGDKLAPGSVSTYQVGGRDGIPSDAQAVLVRLTAVDPEEAGFITAYDAGDTTPNASVLNYAPGQTVGNTFLVKLGAEQKIAIFTHAATHLIIDVFGYTVGSQAFHPQTPYRLLDTRDGAKPAANSTTCMTVAGLHGVPADAKAVSVVLTAVLPDSAGYMVAFAGGEPVPSVRTVSFGTEHARASWAIVPVGHDGKICVHTTAPAHFVVDVTGFFEANAAYRNVTPYRKLDFQSETGATNCFQLAGDDVIPADAQAVAFNVTAVSPEEAGFLTAYPKGTQQPVTSNLNYTVGSTITNSVVAKVGTGGEVCFYTHGASRLLVDVVGYWPAMDNCCEDQSCTSPPSAGCSGAAGLVTYDPEGSCSRGTCDYGHSVITCPYLCQQATCIDPQSFPYHDRTEWQDPAYPVHSTSLMDLNALRYITLHYIGADGVDLSDIPQFLRNAQLDYVLNRGYSLGYNSAVDPDGGEWEIRGFDYRCAANGSQATNIPSYAILLMLPNTWSVPPPAQIEGVRQLVAKIRATAAAAGNDDFLEINGHRDLKATSCPGDVIYDMIQDGTFEP